MILKHSWSSKSAEELLYDDYSGPALEVQSLGLCIGDSVTNVIPSH